MFFFSFLYSHFQCIKSRTICLRVKRRTGNKLGKLSFQHDYFIHNKKKEYNLLRLTERCKIFYILLILFILISAKELAENSHVQDAFVIAVEQQAKERLERLSALRKIKPVDMSTLSQQVSEKKQQNPFEIF